MIEPVYPEDYLLKHRRPGRLLLRPQRAGRIRRTPLGWWSMFVAPRHGGFRTRADAAQAAWLVG